MTSMVAVSLVGNIDVPAIHLSSVMIVFNAHSSSSSWVSSRNSCSIFVENCTNVICTSSSICSLSRHVVDETWYRPMPSLCLAYTSAQSHMAANAVACTAVSVVLLPSSLQWFLIGLDEEVGVETFAAEYHS